MKNLLHSEFVDFLWRVDESTTREDGLLSEPVTFDPSEFV